MDRATPVRNPHTSTADLLTWSETPQFGNAPRSAARSYQVLYFPPLSIYMYAWRFIFRRLTRVSYMYLVIELIVFQPSDGISKVLSGGQITDEEAESLNRRSAIFRLQYCLLTFFRLKLCGVRFSAKFQIFVHCVHYFFLFHQWSSKSV